MNTRRITITDATVFATVCAQLTREGITFKAEQLSNDDFVIDILGF
jgi:hypothetical protein